MAHACPAARLPGLVQEQSQDAIAFLEAAGVNLSALVQLGGHSRKRTHHNPAGPNVGFAIMKALHDRQAATPGIKLITSAQAGAAPLLCWGGVGTPRVVSQRTVRHPGIGRTQAGLACMQATRRSARTIPHRPPRGHRHAGH